jgi:hypothetical protein
MKTLSLLLCFAALTLKMFGAGVTVSSVNGTASGLTLTTTVTNKAISQPSAGNTNVVVINSAGQEYAIPLSNFGGAPGTSNFLQTITLSTNFSVVWTPNANGSSNLTLVPTNIPGSIITLSSINSNKLDAATLALIGSGGGGASPTNTTQNAGVVTGSGSVFGIGTNLNVVVNPKYLNRASAVVNFNATNNANAWTTNGSFGFTVTGAASLTNYDSVFTVINTSTSTINATNLTGKFRDSQSGLFVNVFPCPPTNAYRLTIWYDGTYTNVFEYGTTSSNSVAWSVTPTNQVAFLNLNQTLSGINTFSLTANFTGSANFGSSANTTIDTFGNVNVGGGTGVTLQASMFVDAGSSSGSPGMVLLNDNNGITYNNEWAFLPVADLACRRNLSR